MVDPQTWSAVFSVIAYVYGVLLGLFVVMITFVTGLVARLLEKTTGDQNEALKDTRWLNKWVLIIAGSGLIGSILMLSIGNSINYNSDSFWFVVLSSIFGIVVLLWLVHELVKAISKGLARETYSPLANRIVKYLKDTANKKNLKIEVRFVNEKIIPKTTKNRVEFPAAILSELKEDEIKAIGLHEIGHLVQKSYTSRIKITMVIFLFAYIVPNVVLYLFKIWDSASNLLISLNVLCLIPIFVIIFYSFRHFEYKADNYAKKEIGKDITIKALENLHKWIEKERLQKKWKMSWLDHPPLDSRKKSLEKDC